ncbi:hypothetical protein B0H10DRAFT_2225080 [Mycena sp. CBHHK59/15]|nr:hypothetical protein B0H10DRAFT_2225080 [Mycena sp. CBHHK59/15]
MEDPIAHAPDAGQQGPSAWNPLLPQPEDYENAPPTPIELEEGERAFDPCITVKGNLGDAFRIFTDGLKGDTSSPDTRIEVEPDEEDILDTLRKHDTFPFWLPHLTPLRDAQLPTSQVIPIEGVSAARLTGAFVAMRQREGKTQRQVRTNPPLRPLTPLFLQPRTCCANEELPSYRDAVRSDVSQVPDVRAEAHLVRAGEERRELGVSVLHHVVWCVHAHVVRGSEAVR